MNSNTILSDAMKKSGRRPIDTGVVTSEAGLLSRLWYAVPAKKRASQAEFGHTYEIGNQSAVGQFLRGEAPLSLKAAKGFAKGLGCPISAFSPRLAGEVAEASATNQVAGANADKTWPFLTVSPDQYYHVLTQTQRDILEATAHSFVGAREPPEKHTQPATTATKAQSA